MLRKLLTGKIELEPVGRGRERGHRFRDALCIEPLIGGEALQTSLSIVLLEIERRATELMKGYTKLIGGVKEITRAPRRPDRLPRARVARSRLDVLVQVKDVVGIDPLLHLA